MPLISPLMPVPLLVDFLLSSFQHIVKIPKEDYCSSLAYCMSCFFLFFSSFCLTGLFVSTCVIGQAWSSAALGKKTLEIVGESFFYRSFAFTDSQLTLFRHCKTAHKGSVQCEVIIDLDVPVSMFCMGCC